MKLTGAETREELEKLIGRHCRAITFFDKITNIEGPNLNGYYILDLENGQSLWISGVSIEVSACCVGDKFKTKHGFCDIIDIMHNGDCFEYKIEPTEIINTSVVDRWIMIVDEEDMVGIINISNALSQNTKCSQHCPHPNKKEVHLITSKYLYCPDCKADLGDIK
ncbi:MAG TPA: hypothetical protein VI911_11485 [Patescibacteria group bacterium]|nr:hypothetical protein [Patescibacteria group bacterium]